MKDEYKLSLPTAILININIMLGAGIFINTSTLAQRAGLLSSFMYLLIGVIMLPLILSIAQLLKIHPAGGFYVYGKKEVNSFVGFISGWCYFISKLASCMLMIHVSVTLLQNIFPILQLVSPFLIDVVVVAFFTGLNLLNIKAGSTIQKLFIGFKTLPILFAIATGLFVLQSENFSAQNVKWEGLQTSLPLVVYAIIGFEAACSMSSKIRDAEKNAPKAVLVSFGIVIFIAALYQAVLYGVLGEQLTHCGHCDTFPLLLKQIFGTGSLVASKLEGVLHLAIACSTLGAAYGIIFSNSWNLQTLAKEGHVWFSEVFNKFNKNQIPVACVFVEGALCLIYLTVSQGVLVPLQQIGALGCVIAYSISIVALLKAIKARPEIAINKWIPRLALVSCFILIVACVSSFFVNGMSSLFIYSVLVALGIRMYKTTENQKLVPDIVDLNH